MGQGLEIAYARLGMLGDLHLFFRRSTGSVVEELFNLICLAGTKGRFTLILCSSKWLVWQVKLQLFWDFLS